MPIRYFPLVTDDTYHVFNRSFGQKTIFLDRGFYNRALQTIKYYRYLETPIKYSYFIQQHPDQQQDILKQLEKENSPAVEIYSYCLMPNHFHFLIKQLKDRGILKFISKFSNSYARYFNLKASAYGPVFQGRFATRQIVTNEQLLHVHRYIHLNPYSAQIVRSLKDLAKYPYSSLKEYLKPNKNNISSPDLIRGQFASLKSYQDFIFDQADYQKQLQYIKTVLLE